MKLGEVADYSEVFDRDNINAVRLFLRKFKCGCEELLDAVTKLRWGWQENDRIVAEQVASESFKALTEGVVIEEADKPKKIVEPLGPQTVVDKCPRCGSNLLGMPIPGCETRKSGRVFYVECSSCKYFYEMYQDKRNNKKFKKVEGGGKQWHKEQ